jgi:V/A-type H+-transporting ATPase subunit K
MKPIEKHGRDVQKGLKLHTKPLERGLSMKRAFALGLVLVLLSIAVATVFFFEAMAETETTTTGGQVRGRLGEIGAGLALGFAACGAGIGLGTCSAAAIGVIAEKPELFGRTMIYIVFVEAIAIYGLVMALLLWMTG